ncbi:hypothetical protein ACO0SA_002350 [Hanseniaspora valbyensis]
MEQIEIVKSIFSNLDENYIKQILLENDNDFDTAIDRLSKPNEKTKFNDESDIKEDIKAEKVAMWLNIFPQLTHAEIYNAISNCNDFNDDDELLEELNLIVFNKENGSIETINSEELLSQSIANELLIFEYDLTTIVSNNLLSENNSNLSTTDDIIKKKIDQFVSNCKISRELAEYALELNNYHVGEAIINCILNYHKYVSDLKEKFFIKTSDPVFKSSRVVQRNTNLIKNTASNKINLKSSDIIENGSLNEKTAPFSTNAFINKDKIVRNALDICNSKIINDKLINILISFFNGSEEQTLNLLSFFEKMNFLEKCDNLVNKKEDIDIKEIYNLENYNKQTTNKKTYKKSYTVKKYSFVKKTINSKSSETFSLDNTDNNNLKIASKDLPNYTIDLHGFKSNEAISLISNSLKKWWNEELLQREANATKAHHIQSSKAQFVSTFEIITGKGLHSQNGTSTIKIKCKAYLNNNNYTYIENSGSFTVTGKKKKL